MFRNNDAYKFYVCIGIEIEIEIACKRDQTLTLVCYIVGVDQCKQHLNTSLGCKIILQQNK